MYGDILKQVLEYLTDHPCQTTRQIADSLDLEPSQASCALSQIKAKGLAKCKEIPSSTRGRKVIWFRTGVKPALEQKVADAPAPVETQPKPKNIAGRPHATGYRWSIGHLV
jgi:predicted ArsR family transcriptional regulator